MLSQQKQYNQTLHSLQTNEEPLQTTTEHYKLHAKRASLLECMYDFIWKANINMRAMDNEKA